MNGAAALVRMLSDYGVEVIFGVPGDTNVALYRALKSIEGAPVHVLCRDERSAVFMADCYARISGKPAIAEVPSGAGAMYALPGVAEANESSVPVILLVNDIPRAGVGRGTLTELPIGELFRPIAKHVETLPSIGKLPEVVRRAFRYATAGRPGAAVLALPEDILYEEIPEADVSLHIEPQCRVAPSYRVQPQQDAIDAAMTALLEAKKPLIVAGGGLNRSGASLALTQFAERLNIPVVTTITGQGAVRDNHDLSIGIIGDNGFHPHALWALENADLVVYIGCRMGSVATMNWRHPSMNAHCKIIQIDLNPEVIANTYEVDFPIYGDARAVLEAMINAINPEYLLDTVVWVDNINQRRKEFWEHIASMDEQDPSPIRPEFIIETLNRHLPAPCNVISDAGTPTPYSTRFLKFCDDQSRLVIPRFFGGLGYAIPAVIGAYYAAPNVRPVGLFGDGSLGMSAGELETLSRLDIPAVLIHFNNACFGWIKALQRVTNTERSNDGTFSVDFNPHSMDKLASVYGIHSSRAETPEEFENAIAEAFNHDGPYFIDVVVESIANRVPPVYSWLTKTGANPIAPEKRTAA
ncbi:thiamine pyrophosphate-binding protein [Falsochrobactrum sp. TDYN1]|uniref:Thiamine pyrophosphate-binding protein n=1 Tax=Falsochrobactrum tianjinense TaxID=2706015 RepID=A0A949PQC7_9HYPH|nr:thiamine pyrophosphate-binding protein [Falsochrobactrum sp. TDYN1]MBV2145098.1 thiamine pyrophosphate-binding protein [Falsochrobactrum sp. TDYN1]